MSDLVDDPSASGERVFALSSWGKRVLARLIDWSILVGIFFGYWLISDLLGFEFMTWGPDPGETDSTLHPGESAVWWQPIHLAWVAFQIYLVGTRGQTVGKWALGIKLVRERDATPVGVLKAAFRALMKTVVTISLFLWPINYLWPLWDSKRQALTDKAIRAVVIDVR